MLKGICNCKPLMWEPVMGKLSTEYWRENTKATAGGRQVWWSEEAKSQVWQEHEEGGNDQGMSEVNKDDHC